MGEGVALIGLILLFSILIILGFCIYLIPTIIALKSDHPNKTAIIALNVLGGWTFIVWVVSLVWALSKTEEKAPQVVYIQENSEPVDYPRDFRPSTPQQEARQMQYKQQGKDDDIDIDLL